MVRSNYPSSPARIRGFVILNDGDVHDFLNATPDISEDAMSADESGAYSLVGMQLANDTDGNVLTLGYTQDEVFHEMWKLPLSVGPGSPSFVLAPLNFPAGVVPQAKQADETAVMYINCVFAIV